MQILISGVAKSSVGMTGLVGTHHFSMVTQASLSGPKQRPIPSRIFPISKRSGIEPCEAIGLNDAGATSKTHGSEACAVSLWAWLIDKCDG